MMERRATYRLQLHPGFGFREAAAVLPYLARLGVSHVYCSPYLQAAQGSSHGYDVVDPTRLSEELGGRAGYEVFMAALRAEGLGQILDIVPNHMSNADSSNAWWWDVLEDGRGSPYARFFDIDWESDDEAVRGRVILPVLGARLSECIDAGDITLAVSGELRGLRYFDHVWPLRAETWESLFLEFGIPGLAVPLATLLRLGGEYQDWTRYALRRRVRDELEQALREDAAGAALEAMAATINGDPNRLEDIALEQHYVLYFWREGVRRLDYRRFFDITELVGMRIEDPEVFEATHRLVLDLVEAGDLDGLRADHVDGLGDPAGYLSRLRARTGGAWLLAEKILEKGEDLPAWPVAGTTGYEFGAAVTGLLVDPAGEAEMTAAYADVVGTPPAYPDVIWEAKRQVLDRLLVSDLRRLTRLAVSLLSPAYIREEVRDTLAGLLMAMPVYRTYVVAGAGHAGEEDARILDEARATATARGGAASPEILEELVDLLLLRSPRRAQIDPEAEAEFVQRFQQLSSVLTAKGVEDTAFYRYHRFVCLNEVGDSPAHFGASPAEFHAANRVRSETRPQTMLSTSTHDSKRGEDVRARLALLSEMPAVWRQAVAHWRAINAALRPDILDAPTEYLLYQTLVGAWPLSIDRAVAYMEKAAKEAKLQTSWVSPSEAYDNALSGFVRGLYESRPFIDSLEEFVRPLVVPGRVNALAMVLLKLTSPGVPDIYQGNELWCLNLVDPDNRGPVDFETRAAMLADLADRPLSREALLDDAGSAKLLLTHRVLRARAALPGAFLPGAGYDPILARGEMSEHLVGFVRRGGASLAVTLTPRLVMGLREDWGDTIVDLPGGEYTEVLTGRAVRGGRQQVAGLLQSFPMALLQHHGEGRG